MFPEDSGSNPTASQSCSILHCYRVSGRDYRFAGDEHEKESEVVMIEMRQAEHTLPCPAKPERKADCIASSHELPSASFPLSFMERIKKQKGGGRKREFIFGSDPVDSFRKTVLLVGPKGSGKTSLVNSLANLINNVTATAPYRLHITPVNDKVPSGAGGSSMNYAPTGVSNTYVFQHNTPLGFPIAFVDTPPLGLDENANKESTVAQIHNWYQRDYLRPVEDLEVWFVISAVDSKVSHQIEVELRQILDEIEWKVRVVPIITFAKRRRPVLALKVLEQMGFSTEREGVDYFTVNNGSVLGLCTDMLETNALTFDECIEHLRSALLSGSEPAIRGDLVPLHISMSSDDSTANNSQTSTSASASLSSSPLTRDAATQGSAGSDSTLSRPSKIVVDAPPAEPHVMPPPPARRRPPAYEDLVRFGVIPAHQTLPPPRHKAARSADEALATPRRNLAFVSISPYETLV